MRMTRHCCNVHRPARRLLGASIYILRGDCIVCTSTLRKLACPYTHAFVVLIVSPLPTFQESREGKAKG